MVILNEVHRLEFLHFLQLFSISKILFSQLYHLVMLNHILQFAFHLSMFFHMCVYTCTVISLNADFKNNTICIIDMILTFLISF